MTFNGYDAASDIDADINSMLREDPITKDTAVAWMNFARTMETTLIIITKAALDTVKEVMQARNNTD